MAEVQEKTEGEIIQWFEKDVLPHLVSDGRLPVSSADPKDLVIANIQYEETERGTDHFASLPYFVRVTLFDKKEPTRQSDFHLVVKFINQKLAVRQAMETDTQFFNEMLFYNEILPAFQDFINGRSGVPVNFIYDICPVCRYAYIDMDKPEFGIVVMNDLRHEGFACATSKFDLDLDHCLVAMKKLAKFHALSFAMKLENFELLKNLSAKFVECRYQEDRYKEEMNNMFIERTSLRAIEYLLAQDECEVPKTYLHMLKEKISAGPYKMMGNFIVPIEPLSVICHGDFCRNNILYKVKDGKAIDCKLFDFQTWRYSSPAVDLVFFIYMNTSLKLREIHFEEIFNCYVSTVIETTALITSKTNLEIEEHFPRANFFKEFGELSLYGYSIASFFLPMMMEIPENAADFEKEWETLTFEEMTTKNLERGGEAATKRIADIIIDMYRRKFYL